jgi:hypothetical protein
MIRIKRLLEGNMLHFLAEPEHYIQSPITQHERSLFWAQRLRGWFRNLIFLLIMSLTIAVIPLFLYGGFLQGLIFKIVAVIVVVTYGSIILHTVLLATHTITREKQAATWDSLVLTEISTRELVLAKWWSVVATVWPEFVIVTLMKAAFAYGLAEYFYMVNNWECDWAIGPTLCRSVFASSIPFTPPFYSIVAALLMLTLFGLIDAAVIAALALGAVLVFRHTVAVVVSLALRLILLIALPVMWASLNSVIPDYLESYYPHSTYAEYIFVADDKSYRDDDNGANGALHGYLMAHDWQTLLEGAQITLSVPSDSGVLLATDMMRPASTHLHFTYSVISASFATGLYFVLLCLSLRVAIACGVWGRVHSAS